MNNCQSCKHWKIKYLRYGDCLNPLNEIKFIPYGKEILWKEFKGTIDDFNRLSKPNNIPLIALDYHCTFYESRDIIESK